MTDLSFGGVSLAAAVPEALVTEVSRGLLGSSRDSYQTVPGRAGSWVFPEQPGDRTVRVGVHLLGDTYAQRRAAVVNLADWADVSAPAQLIIDDEPDRYWIGKLAGDSSPEEWLLGAETELEFRCQPYAYATALTTESWAFTGATAHAWTIPDEVWAQPVLELVAGSGQDITAWSVTSAAGLLTGAVGFSGGGAVTINGISYMVTTGVNLDTLATGYFPAAQVAMATVAGEFPALAPGANTITLATTGAGGATKSGTATLKWRRRFRG